MASALNITVPAVVQEKWLPAAPELLALFEDFGFTLEEIAAAHERLDTLLSVETFREIEDKVALTRENVFWVR
jgi:hypothetical protein